MVVRVLFVCLGNICRSPAAEAVFRQLVADAGLDAAFSIDSAGTGGWHVGEHADRRMRQAAKARGIDVTSIVRQVVPEDFERFDHILAMDSSNLRDLQSMAPAQHHEKIRLFRDLDPDAPGEDVPDPYYGDLAGFDDVLDIVTRAAQGLLEDLQAKSKAG